jgi:hypothetical protein
MPPRNGQDGILFNVRVVLAEQGAHQFHHTLGALVLFDLSCATRANPSCSARAKVSVGDLRFEDGLILREQLFDQRFDPWGYAKIDQSVAY